MKICSFALRGYEGCLVTVETDLRRGLPGTEIIGLPDSAVKEAKERVRAALKNSCYQFPTERLLINLTPAGVKKEGTVFDLAIAVAILQVSRQLGWPEDVPFPDGQVLILGELELSGQVRGVAGALSAIASAYEAGVQFFIVAQENAAEAQAVLQGNYWIVSSLAQATEAFVHICQGHTSTPSHQEFDMTDASYDVDLQDIKGQPLMRRALEVAAAGRHHLLFFGPPGCGKTLSCRALPSLFPPLNRTASLETSRIYSLKGLLNNQLVQYVPFRQPHHSATAEGILGGGRIVSPGEASLAHHGILFLDEAPEFGKEVLQNLREPLESKKVTLARAGQSVWFPADFQLVMAANVCPCGALGKDDKVCLCSPKDIGRYWKRIGSAILDRIDIRVPAKPVSSEVLLHAEEEPSSVVRQRVAMAIERQKQRFKGLPFQNNASIPPSHIKEFCYLLPDTEKAFLLAVQKLSLSSRAGHSILRLARTIADLDESDDILPRHALEAASYRRYGDSDLYWTEI